MRSMSGAYFFGRYLIMKCTTPRLVNIFEFLNLRWVRFLKFWDISGMSVKVKDKIWDMFTFGLHLVASKYEGLAGIWAVWWVV